VSEIGTDSGRSLTEGAVVAGRYRVERLLGEGAMGAVYLVEHVHMRKRFALKVLLSEARENPEIVARFEREAVAAANVDHPNVVAASDFGTTEDGSFFLVLEYIEGESLRDVIERGPLPLSRVVPIAAQIGAALGKAHGMGIVHRDLKPENVMLVPRDTSGEPELVKVLDFGIAKVPSRDAKALTAAGAIFGTPEYMSPEQAVGQAVDARADLYSFGIMIFEMITGRRPFDSEHVMGYLAAHLNTPVPPMRELAPDVHVPEGVEAVVRRMLAKVPEERFPSVRDAIAALEIAQGAPASDDGFSGPSPFPGTASAARFSLADASAKTLLPGQHDVAPAATATRAKGVQTYTAEGLAKARGVLHEIDALLPLRVRALPTAAKAGALGVLGVVALVVLAGLFAGPRGASGELASPADAAPTPATEGLTDDTIARAETEGLAAVDALITKLPSDPRLARARVRVARAEGNPKEALAALDRLLTLAPDAANEAATAELLLEGLDGDAELAAATMPVVEKAGAVGVDALVACIAKPTKHKKECSERLASPKARAAASPATKVLLDFKDAQGCQGKYALLDRAKEHGDPRLLPSLKPLTYTSGCGFFRGSDCWKCLRRDKKLPEAIAAIEGRSAEK